MSVLWFDGAKVILPLGHKSPLLVHVAGHDGHCQVHLVRPLGDPVDLVAGHVGLLEVHLVRSLGDPVIWVLVLS